MDSNAIFIDGLFIPEADRIGEEGARSGHDAAWQAIMTHGGFGYAKEYHVERLFREISITRLAPITEQLMLSFIAEKVLDPAEKLLTRAEKRLRGCGRSIPAWSPGCRHRSAARARPRRAGRSRIRA